MKSGARAEERQNPAQVVFIDHTDVARGIEAVHMDESDSKFNEEVLEFNNSTWREYELELYYRAIPGEVMIKEPVDAARKVEMETFNKHGVYEKVSIEDCWRSVGKAPVGASGSTRTRATRRIPSTGAGWWPRRSRRTGGRTCSQQCPLRGEEDVALALG